MKYTLAQIDQLIIDRLAEPQLVADIILDVMTCKSKSEKYKNLGVGSGHHNNHVGKQHETLHKVAATVGG